MNKKVHLLIGTLLWIIISSCGDKNLNKEELYGKWQVFEAENKKFAEEMWINPKYIGHIGFDGFVLVAPYFIEGDTIFVGLPLPYDTTLKDFIDTIILAKPEIEFKDFDYKVKSSWVGNFYLKRISHAVPKIDDSPEFVRRSSNEMMDRWINY